MVVGQYLAHLCSCGCTRWIILWSVGFSCFLVVCAMRGFLAGGQNHFGSLSATSQSWLWYKATSVAGPEGQAYPLACTDLKLGCLLPLDFPISGFAVALRDPFRSVWVLLLFH